MARYQAIFFAISFHIMGSAASAATTTQTIILMRHGEKPEKGLGQLNCQGLNRALALPAVMRKNFGKLDALFAPDPAQSKQDSGVLYDYIRPLATIEPTAIAFGLPVNTHYGFADLDGLKAALEQPDYRNAHILVAWEHKQIDALARGLLSVHGADPKLVPDWKYDDYDSLYIITLTRDSAMKTHAQFALDHEGLNEQPEFCRF